MTQESARDRNSRAVAARIIERWLRTDLFPDRLIAPGTEDRAFVVEVVYGVVKRLRTLQWVVDRFAERSPEVNVLAPLLVGLYQVLLMDTVQDYAAVNETVEAVRSAGLSHAAGFVNGVLRRTLRERESILCELNRQNIAVAESHPDFLVKRWISCFGEERTAALCKWNNGRARATVAFNPLKTDGVSFATSLQDGGVAAEPHAHAPERFLTLPAGTRIPPLPGFAAGHFSVQDPSTFVAVRLLDPQPGDIVLDACASPGGKTVLIAEQMQDTGTVIAMDLYRDRLGILEQNITRMDLCSVKPREGNAASEEDVRNACPDDLFDRILLDVPCSNTGVLRRRPDARWRVNEEKLGQLTKIQRMLLESVSIFLKPGGTMVYSTCSLEREENEKQIDGWLARNDGFEITASAALFPPDSRTDGVYAAALKRLK